MAEIITINSSSSSNSTANPSSDRTSLPTLSTSWLELIHDASTSSNRPDPKSDHSYLQAWLDQQDTQHELDKEQNASHANGLDPLSLPTGLERLLHAPILAKPEDLKPKRKRGQPTAVESTLPPSIDEDTVDEAGYKAFCQEIAKKKKTTFQPTSTEAVPDAGFITPKRPIKVKVPSAPKRPRYASWSMSRLQEEFLTRFTPQSQKRTLDKEFMASALFEDDNKAKAPKSLSAMLDKKPPASYLCFRCMKDGHWIQNCPGVLPASTSVSTSQSKSQTKSKTKK